MLLPPLTSTYLRRIARLCCHFTRNVAYYRLGYVDENGKQATEFGATINGNMVDIAVLEWCKLYADRKGHHHWNRLVRHDVEQRQFLAELLHILEVNETIWHQYLDEFRVYRDKFIAHLDTEELARIPQLDMALQSTYFLYSRLLADAPKGTFDMPRRVNLPHDLPAYFCFMPDRCASGICSDKVVSSPAGPCTWSKNQPCHHELEGFA